MTVVVVLSGFAAAVAPEPASAFYGSPQPWTYVNKSGVPPPTWTDGGAPQRYRGKFKDQLKGPNPRMFPYYPGEANFWQRLRRKIGGFKPSRFTGTFALNSITGVQGGYLAWKLCSSVILDECDFLGLRDTVGNWGDPTVRTTFWTSVYQWIYVSSGDYWELRHTQGQSTVYGPGAVLQKTFDGGATWTNHAATAGDCSALTAVQCNQANTEIYDVQETSNRGSLVTQSVNATTRVRYLRISDALFQDSIWDDGDYWDEVPNTTDWPQQQTSTHAGDMGQGLDVADHTDPSWTIIYNEIEAEGEDGKTAINTGLEPEYEGEPNTFTFPDCLGLTVALCIAELDGEGHTGTVTTTVVLPEAADVEYGPDEVIWTNPAQGATWERADPVELSVNPAVEDMPIGLPAPNPGETYADYVTRLQGLGWIGTATVTELSEAAGDPRLGPNAPVTVQFVPVGVTTPLLLRLPGGWPIPNPKILKDTPITFTKNPPTYAPVPPTSVPPATGGGIPPTPDIDFTPITGIDFGCRFPYGFICYAQDVTEWFNVSPDAPRFAFDLSGFDTPIGTVSLGEYVVDLEVMDEYMSLLRGLMSVALWIGTVYLLATRLLNFRAGGDPGEAVDEGLDWR